MPSSSTALQWLSLVGIIWLQAINGTNTNFPSYSSQLKQLLSMSQLQLNNLAFASDAGKLFGWISGVAAIYLPLWLVLILGSTLSLIGYGLQYLVVTNQIRSLPYWQIFFLTVLSGNSMCWINTVCYVVAIKNFPFSDSQVAVGLTTSYQGLSAKLYTNIVDAVAPHKKAQAFLLLNSIMPLIICAVTIPFVRHLNVGRARNFGMGFIAMFAITVTTGIYAVMSSLKFASMKISSFTNLVGILVALLLPLVIPLAEMIRRVWEKWYRKGEIKVHHSTVEDTIDRERENGFTKTDDYIAEENRVVADRFENDDEDRDDTEVHQVVVKEEIGVNFMIRRVEFWLYVSAYFLGPTLGLVFLNNLGQIAESRGCYGTSSLVSLSSSFGFFGRVMSAIGDYYFSRRKNTISRPASIVVLMIPIAGAFFLLVNKTDLALYISTAVIGVCTGAITSIAVSTTTELFGTKNFSVNHNVVVANIPVGSFAFGFLAAGLYHKEGDGRGKCLGMKCYKNTCIIWGCLCVLGTLLALILHCRTRKFYSHPRQQEVMNMS